MGNRTKFGPAADIDWPVMRWYLIAIIVAFVTLLIRLFYLQVIQHDAFRLKSLDNLIRPVQTPAPRGDVFDRAGRPLAKDKNVFSLLYSPPADVADYFLSDAEQFLLHQLTPAELISLAALTKEQLLTLQSSVLLPELARLDERTAGECQLLGLLSGKDVAWLRALPLWALKAIEALPAKALSEIKQCDPNELSWLSGQFAEELGGPEAPSELPPHLLRALAQDDADLVSALLPTSRNWLAGADPPAARRRMQEKLNAIQQQIPVELSWLKELSVDQLDLLSSLGPTRLSSLQGRSASQLGVLRQLISDELEQLAQRSAKQLGLHFELTGVQTGWLQDLSVAELIQLSQVKGNPGQLHPRIIQEVAASGSEPFLNRYPGKPQLGKEKAKPNLQYGKPLQEVDELAADLGIPYTQLMTRLKKECSRVYGYQPVTLVDELTTDQLVYLGERVNGGETKALIDRYASLRVYPQGTAAAHLLGYTGLTNEQDPQQLRDLGYGPRERVGKDGVERSFERLLHGAPGTMYVEVDNKRAFQRVVKEIPPVKGHDIYLTVDSQLQARAHQLLRGRPGAIIVSALSPGHESEIMALCSSPAFDYSRFNETGYYEQLLKNPDLPLINRAYRHAFAPGSTFKLVSATAALQEKRFSVGSTFYCRGYLELGRDKHRFYCHNRSGHGTVTLLEAISESCDVGFYHIGLGLGDASPAIIKRYANEFGYGAPLGLELPGEVVGLVPDKEWKKRNYAWANAVDQAWYDGDTCNYIIGQGYLTATPLQVLFSAQTVALGGMFYPPRLLYAKREGAEAVREEAARGRRLALDAEVLSKVRDGMRLAVTSGTCKKLNLPGMSVCAKSGTAETRPGESPHSWVVGFYPMRNPQYAFVVFFQNGGSAGEAAVPAAREILLYLKEHPSIN